MEIAQSGAAVYVNKFFVSIGPAGTRIAFAEQATDYAPVFRSAILLSIADTFALAGLLKDLLDKNVVVTPTPAPEAQGHGSD
jgi:hypothetical protein